MLLLVLLLASVPAHTLGKFITCKDYDFLGKDKKLEAALRSRLPVVNITEVEDEEQNDTTTTKPSSYSNPVLEEYKPEILQSERFNISLDYGDVPSVSRADEEVLARELAKLLPPPSNNGTRSGRRGPLHHYDAPKENLSERILLIMKQDIYAVQARLAEVERVVKKYKKDERFRIAYIYNKIIEWQRDMKMIGHMIGFNYKSFRFLHLLLFYKVMVRKDIDVTYSIEQLIYLHNKFMKALHAIVPADQLKEIAEARKLKKAMSKNDLSDLSQADKDEISKYLGKDVSKASEKEKKEAMQKYLAEQNG